MALLHISLKLPLVLWTDSLILDLLFSLYWNHWVYNYQLSWQEQSDQSWKWEESSGALSLCSSHQSFRRRALAKLSTSLWQGGPVSSSLVSTCKSSFFLSWGPAVLHPFSSSFLCAEALHDHSCRQVANWAWRPSFLPTFWCAFLMSEGSRCPPPHSGHRLTAHLPGQARDCAWLAEGGSCLSPQFNGQTACLMLWWFSAFFTVTNHCYKCLSHL